MNVAVYCSSRANLPDEVVDIARQLGQWLGSHGHTLVYGGVNAGLMHIVAEATHRSGGHVTGVITRGFAHRADSLVDNMVLTDDLNERKSRMIALADAFVVLPGGIGTIDEWFSTLSQLVVNQDSTRGMIIVNYNHMYDAAWQQLRDTASSPYADDSCLRFVTNVTDAASMLKELENI